MRAFYIVPSRKAVLEIECATLREVCDLVDAPRKTQVKLKIVHDNGDETVDILITSAFPPADQGKFIICGDRYVGRGIILASDRIAESGIVDMETMSSPIKALEQYANEISY